MELFEDVTREFGRRLGIPSLSPGAAGGVDLVVERIGRLQMEQSGDFVLVTLARNWPAHAEAAAITALSLCHWSENHPWPVNAGAKGSEWLTLTARIPLREYDVPTLDRLIGYLSNLLDAVEKAG